MNVDAMHIFCERLLVRKLKKSNSYGEIAR
jgi:hypothetical protein